MENFIARLKKKVSVFGHSALYISLENEKCCPLPFLHQIKIEGVSCVTKDLSWRGLLVYIQGCRPPLAPWEANIIIERAKFFDSGKRFSRLLGDIVPWLLRLRVCMYVHHIFYVQNKCSVPHYTCIIVTIRGSIQRCSWLFTTGLGPNLDSFRYSPRFRFKVNPLKLKL